MTVTDAKTDLRDYLQEAREAMLWKLDGLSEYDIRRPLVRTGTNLLGLVRHLAAVERGYFGVTFGRPSPDPVTWDDSSTDWDLLARPDESREAITGLYRRAWAHADTVISALPLNVKGRVPWWRPETNEVTLHQILVHVVTETVRHAGHADIIRELIDGAAGMTPGNPDLTQRDEAQWRSYHDRVESSALEAARQA